MSESNMCIAVLILTVVTLVVTTVYVSRPQQCGVQPQKPPRTLLTNIRALGASKPTCRCIIYIIAFDDFTEKSALKNFGHYQWAKVVVIPSSNYLFENVMFDEWLPAHEAEWAGADYVGMLSWKAPFKIDVPDIDEFQRVTAEQAQKPEVVAFYHRPDLALVEPGHPKLRPIWSAWLAEMGYSPSVTLNPDIPFFACNYWMASPKQLQAYLVFFQKAKLALQTCAFIQSDLWSDSMYEGALSKSRLRELTGREYYPYHAFLLERLPCFFFWISNVEVHAS
jgi:hypothetical protein